MKLTVKMLALLSVLAMCIAPVSAHAASSSNFRIDEDFVGDGGDNQSSSTNYQIQETLGASAVGDGASTGFGQQAGATTTDDPTLTFIVNTSSINLGSLSTSITRTGTATFTVLNYTSYGYVVQAVGNPPDNGAHTLSGMGVTAASAIGSEQFGINLKDNATPDIGSEPQQVPDSSFSFGGPASGYDTTDTFKYVSGDVIASATKSSGRTDYTISYIANISNNTPGGSYSGSQILVITGTY